MITPSISSLDRRQSHNSDNNTNNEPTSKAAVGNGATTQLQIEGGNSIADHNHEDERYWVEIDCNNPGQVKYQESITLP